MSPLHDDTMLPCKDLPQLQDTAGFARTSVREKMSSEPTRNSRSRHCCKVLKVIRLGKMCTVPEAVLEKSKLIHLLKM